MLLDSDERVGLVVTGIDMRDGAGALTVGKGLKNPSMD